MYTYSICVILQNSTCVYYVPCTCSLFFTNSPVAVLVISMGTGELSYGATAERKLFSFHWNYSDSGMVIAGTCTLYLNTRKGSAVIFIWSISWLFQNCNCASSFVWRLKIVVCKQCWMGICISWRSVDKMQWLEWSLIRYGGVLEVHNFPYEYISLSGGF